MECRLCQNSKNQNTIKIAVIFRKPALTFSNLGGSTSLTPRQVTRRTALYACTETGHAHATLINVNAAATRRTDACTACIYGDRTRPFYVHNLNFKPRLERIALARAPEAYL